MPAKGKGGPDTISSLRSVVPGVFDAAQRSIVGHRKHAVTLHKLQLQCHEHDSKGLTGEDAFNKEFIRNLNKVLGIKKREPSADKIVKLVATFVQVGHEIDVQVLSKKEKEKNPNRDEDDVFGEDASMRIDGGDSDENTDTVSSRFVELLIRYLLQGFQAKEKLTRLRCCQIVAMSVTSLGEIDEELYFELIKKLTERVHDKESSIRMHAAVALSKLQSGEEDEGGEVAEALLDLLQNDPSSEVRRAVLLNVEKTPSTLPYVLERARDVDSINRKCLFLKVMPPIDYHLLSIEDRERLLAAGINDRDANVRRACVRMIGESWLTFADQNLLELTSSLDVVDSPVASKVMQSLFTAYPEIPENLDFDQELWENLTPEMAFIIRSTIEFFNERKDADKIDKHLPDAMKLAQMLESLGARLESEAEEEVRPDYEFIIHQLLLVARMSDFPDEIGRREMLTLMRKMIMVPEIPENNIEAISDIIRKLSIGEQDFIRIMAEIVSDVRELAPELTSSSPKETRLEALLVSIKCLIIIKYILQRCFDTLSEGSSMYALLTECVVPAVQSSETVLQEYGIECLALFCLLDKSLAVDNIVLFAQAVKHGSGELHKKGLAAILDLAFMYGITDLSSSLGTSADFVDLIYQELESEDVKIQATAGEGLAKLLYAHRIPEAAGVLEELLVLYFHPNTSGNDALRQCLTYFFPAFSYMSHENQSLMQQVAIKAICRLTRVLKHQPTQTEQRQKQPGDGPGGATQGQAAQQIVVWSDPRILEAISSMNNSSSMRTMTTSSARMGTYSALARDALKQTFKESPGTRKVLVQLLNKLALDEKTPHIQLQEMFVLVRTLSQKELITDMITRNALVRFENSLLKLLEIENANDVNLEGWLEEPEMAAVFEFVSSLEDGDAHSGEETEATEDEDNSMAGEKDNSAAGSDSEASEPHGAHDSLQSLKIKSAMPLPTRLKTRSPLKRSRDEHLEELTREIDELLDTDDEDEDNGYLNGDY
ncbi:chromosome condensation complex Condensin, subunit G [Coemansia sp. RSA 1813]|nr:chromosome condensation complex Condensin, subunit G [Coemansia sp. RSA 1646]KAJ1773129.1 chromosome condensation complex Condensin, subunit G [Coemansia sp. RSA 1843]KAJ2092006.1 chromosome condensation complex Condensin, subunit G [Coemansia sp. RSA 986]KAJ2216657.1 chromosome condensation complex Condensin, subunit G [Coemansia sp. RSA 487]KAJ2572057.1 chromosome condensation complex Condensin, subunit G [Coemansia sp. RSA 1813]